MPVYNGGRYLDEAIWSIRNQTFDDFELLILDDASSDGSLMIAQAHAGEDPRIRVICLDHCGVTRALNNGLYLARGHWIARMDADDVSLPERFERQLGYLARHPEVAVLATYAWIIGETGRRVGLSTLGPVTIDEFERMRSEVSLIFCHPTVIFRRDVVTQAGGYSEDYPWAQDYELWNRLAEEHLLLTLPEPLLEYRIHASASGTRHMRDQAELARRVVVNTRRRRSGQPLISRDEFHAVEAAQPILMKISRERSVRSQRAYRIGGGFLAAGNPVGLFWLGCSFLLSPGLPLRRFWRQVAAPVFRIHRHRAT